MTLRIPPGSRTQEKKIEKKHEILFYRLKCQKANAHNLAKFCYPRQFSLDFASLFFNIIE